MAKRTTKTDAKAKKATQEPTEDQAKTGTVAQAEAGNKPASAPKNTPADSDASKAGGGDVAPPADQERIVADTPPAPETDPSEIATALVGDASVQSLAVGQGLGNDVTDMVRALDTEGDQADWLDEYGPSYLLITVVGPRNGFRRAGRTFGPEAVTFGADEVTGRQLVALEAEPKLLVTINEKPVALSAD